MKKFILNVMQTEKRHAGSKAQDDISFFLHQEKYMNIYVDGEMNRFERLLFFKHDFKKKISILDANDILLIQFPFYLGNHVKKIVANCVHNKHVKGVILIHDLPSLRDEANESVVSREIDWLNKFEVLISHSSKMTEWLKNHGCTSEIIDLELFDYYINDNSSRTSEIGYNHKPKLLFAGNIGKSPFVNDLYPQDYELDLIGIGDSNLQRKNVKHMGSFPPEKLPEQMNGQFGLVWDGKLTKNSTNYMRYNDPHKASLYLGCGLPIIVWSGAAIAEVVKKYHVGVVLDSLDELNIELTKITEVEYNILLENVVQIRNKLRNGFFIKKAIKKAEKYILERKN